MDVWKATLTTREGGGFFLVDGLLEEDLGGLDEEADIWPLIDTLRLLLHDQTKIELVVSFDTLKWSSSSPSWTK